MSLYIMWNILSTGGNRKLGRILHRESQAPVVGGYYSASARLITEYCRSLLLL